MPVTYLITFDIRPGQRERFLSLLNGVLDSMRAEPTFREAVLHEDSHPPHLFMLHETWEDHEEVIGVQMYRAYRQEWHNALPELLETERDVSMWRELRTDRAPAPSSTPSSVTAWPG